MNHSAFTNFNINYIFDLVYKRKKQLLTLFLVTFILSLGFYQFNYSNKIKSTSFFTIQIPENHLPIDLVVKHSFSTEKKKFPLIKGTLTPSINNSFYLNLIAPTSRDAQDFLTHYFDHIKYILEQGATNSTEIIIIDNNATSSFDSKLIVLFSLLTSFSILFFMIAYLIVSSDKPQFFNTKKTNIKQRLNLTDHIVLFLLTLFLISFFILPRIPNIPLRFEDLIFIVLFLFSYKYINIPKSPLFYLISIFFLINFFSYFIYIITNNYVIHLFPMILIKEIQYVYIAYLLYYYQPKNIIKLFDGLIIFCILYGLLQLLLGKISYYGIGTVNSISPSLSGSQYFLSVIWLHIRLKFFPSKVYRYTYKVMMILGTICVFATISRASILAMALYFISYYLLKSPIKAFTYGTLFLAIGTSAILLLNKPLILKSSAKIFNRMSYIGEDNSYRFTKWRNQINTLATPELLFGQGKGYGNFISGKDWGMGIDSQYSRTIIENGIIGLLLLGCIFYYIIQRTYFIPKVRSHMLAFFIAFSFFCIPFEALQISKSGTFFWILCFHFLSLSNLSQPSKLKQLS